MEQRHAVLWLRWLLFLVVMAIGCGDEGTVVVIEPNVESVFAINDNGMVTLGWTAWEDGTPDEIDVHRSSVADFTPSGTTYYSTLPGGSTRFDDVGVTNGSHYYYRLVPIEISDRGQRLSGTPSNIAIGRPYDYTAISEITYTEHIQPIFTSSCAVHGCHVGYEDVAPDKHPRILKTAHGGQFSLRSWDELFQGSTDGAVAIPFKSSKSDLVLHANSDTLIAPVSDPHMPLPGFNLPSAQIATLIQWIDDGAKDDFGEIPYSVTPLGKMLVACSSEDLIAVIDVQTNLLIRYINVGSSADPTAPFGTPHHVKVDPTGQHFYATLINSQQLWKFSSTTYELEGTVGIPFQPADLTFSPTGDTAYVTSFTSNPGLVTLVDTRTMRALGSIYPPFSSLPHGIVISHDASKLFVTNAGSGNVAMINTADNSASLIALDTLGNPFSSVSPYLVDLTPDDRYLFVTDYAQGGENVYIIDLVSDPTKPSYVIPIGGRSVHVAVTPDGQSAFVCNLTTNSVHVISIPDFSVTTIANVGKQPHGVLFTPDGTKAYVTTENILDPDPPHHPSSSSVGVSYVYVIDVASLQILQEIEIGAFGAGIAFLP